jgi:hypothetical protein
MEMLCGVCRWIQWDNAGVGVKGVREAFCEIMCKRRVYLQNPNIKLCRLDIEWGKLQGGWWKLI